MQIDCNINKIRLCIKDNNSLLEIRIPRLKLSITIINNDLLRALRVLINTIRVIQLNNNKIETLFHII